MSPSAEPRQPVVFVLGHEQYARAADQAGAGDHPLHPAGTADTGSADTARDRDGPARQNPADEVPDGWTDDELQAPLDEDGEP